MECKITGIFSNNNNIRFANLGPYAYTTATATMTPSKKCVYILLWNFSFVENYSVCLSVLELAPAEYAANELSSK